MRLAPLQSLTVDDLHAWEDLAQRAIEPNPFFEPAFVTAAADALGAGDVHLLVEDRAGRWLGCMPSRITRLLGRPLAVSSWKHPYSFLGTPLVDRDCVDEFAQALAGDVAARRHGRFAMLRRSSDDLVVKAIRAAAKEVRGVRVVREHGDERALLERRPEPSYLDGLRSHHRREIRRLRRRLGEELGGEPTIRDCTEDPAATEEFLRLEASGWKGREGTAMAQSNGSAELFRSLCAKFAASGRLQLLALEAGGRVAAMKCNLSAGDTLFCFKIAFDDELKRYSPGIQLEIENVDLFHQRDELQMDSCAESTNEMINRLWPDRRAIVTLTLGPTGPSGWIGGRVLDAGHAVRTRRNRGSTHS